MEYLQQFCVAVVTPRSECLSKRASSIRVFVVQRTVIRFLVNGNGSFLVFQTVRILHRDLALSLLKRKLFSRPKCTGCFEKGKTMKKETPKI